MYDATDLIDYLNHRKIPFRVSEHPEAVTAMEAAEAEHVSGKRFAKTVAVKHGDKVFLTILPAHLRLNLAKLERVCEGPIEMATEGEFAARFPNCEVGAIPPFGGLYGVDVYMDDDIAVSPEVTFRACSHRHAITISGKDFLKAAEAVVADISEDALVT